MPASLCFGIEDIKKLLEEVAMALLCIVKQVYNDP